MLMCSHFFDGLTRIRPSHHGAPMNGCYGPPTIKFMRIKSSLSRSEREVVPTATPRCSRVKWSTVVYSQANFAFTSTACFVEDHENSLLSRSSSSRNVSSQLQVPRAQSCGDAAQHCSHNLMTRSREPVGDNKLAV